MTYNFEIQLYSTTLFWRTTRAIFEKKLTYRTFYEKLAFYQLLLLFSCVGQISPIHDFA